MKKQCLNIDNIHNDQLVGDPVDTLTGTVFEKKMEFRLIGPLEFKWIRRYDSSKNHRLFALGWGHTHDYDRRLYFDADGISYEEPLGKRYGFPPLFKNGAIHQAHGYTLERVSPTCFRLHKHALPSMEFNIRQANSVARLSRLYKDENQILFFYDVSQRLVRIV
ncbi:MAG: DUF6531 domain-containing protein, partial [Gammaproteobacteria bacterium]|nr:DUF6531 domain-containing protein [Gammaproteobacteria bacterium]